jgi:protein-tyrosine phosphatase
VFRQKVREHALEDVVRVDSAGTHDFHPGVAPDARSQDHAAQRGYDLSALRARQIRQSDFEQFDLILAMDWQNLSHIQEICPPNHLGKLRRMTEFCVKLDSPVVPDPYYRGPSAFEHVLDLVEDASEGLISHIRKNVLP